MIVLDLLCELTLFWRHVRQRIRLGLQGQFYSARANAWQGRVALDKDEAGCPTHSRFSNESEDEGSVAG